MYIIGQGYTPDDLLEEVDELPISDETDPDLAALKKEAHLKAKYQ